MTPAEPAEPAKPFEPYQPDGRFPWAGHLLRRCAFGPTRARLDALAKQSPPDALDALLNYDAAADPYNHLLDDLDGFLAPFVEPRQLQAWWLYRMLRTPRPFQERIALFWHNRFATSLGKVERVPLMHQQIELFRKNGLGNYRDLLLAVGRDPAMLIWLDGLHSRKGKPNENYARELMELFTLGIGNYTEHDIQEVARSFTGWSIRDSAGVLDPKGFDDGEKEIFTHRGRFTDENVIDLILDRPESTRFLSLKLLQEFVHPAPTASTLPAFLQSFAYAENVGNPNVANDNILVVVQLSGGNDGLNTVIPVASDAYHKARPRIGLKDRTLKLDDTLSLNPGMTAFKELFDQGQLASSLAAFHKDLTAKGLANKVTVMCFSEFGRRVNQNDSNGTDHGAAAPLGLRL